MTKTKTIKFDVLSRYSGEVQFTAEIECKPDHNYIRDKSEQP